MLRLAARQEAGHEIKGRNGVLVESFLEGLAREDLVVHYDPNRPPYFFRVPRRRGIDTGLVRNPTLDDDGNGIKSA